MAETMLAADGTPLKRSLARALRRQKMRALALIAPLLLFVVITFIVPIASMLFRSVENEIVSNTLPYTVEALASWDANQDALPSEDAFQAMFFDMFVAAEAKRHTRLGTRLNYETTGLSSLFRQSGRKLDKGDGSDKRHSDGRQERHSSEHRQPQCIDIHTQRRRLVLAHPEDC